MRRAWPRGWATGFCAAVVAASTPLPAAAACKLATLLREGGNEAVGEFLRGRGLQMLSFFAADIDHRRAVEKSQRRGAPAPSDFRGAAHEALAVDG